MSQQNFQRMTDLLILVFILHVKERYPCKYPQDKGQDNSQYVKANLKNLIYM